MARRIVNNSLLDVKPQLNLLANGGFEQWSGGISITALGGYFTPAGPDSWGWGQGHTGDTILTASKETSLQYKGSACLKVVITGTTAQSAGVGQFIGGFGSGEPGTISFAKSVRGKTLTLSIAVKTTIANKVKIRLRDDIGLTDSSYHTGSGNWEILTATRTIDASAAYVLVFLGEMVSGDFSVGTFYADAAMLVIGDRPVTFVPENPELDKVKSGATSDLQKNTANLLVNGGFRIWNQGVDFTNPPSLTIMADGWQLLKAGTSLPNVDVSRSYTQQESGPYCMGVQCISAGSGLTDGVRFYQPVYEIEKRPMDKYLTLTARVKTSDAGKWRIGLGLGASTSYSSYHTGSGVYETLTVSKLINHATNGISVEFGMLQPTDVTAGAVAFIDNAMLVIGQTGIDYATEGYATAVQKASFKDFLTYRRPDLSWASVTEIGAEPNTYRLGATEIVVLFPDGEMRRVLGSDTNLRRMNITETASNTSPLNSGLRSGLSEAANTWYAIYAWKSIDNDGKFVLVADTTPPAINNYATLNTRYGENAWVFLGYVRNGFNTFGGAGQDLDLVRFVQFNGITMFPWSIGSRYPFGVPLAQATAATLTYTPTTGMTGSDLPDTIGHVKWGTQISGTGGGTGYSVTSGVSPTNGFMFEDSSKTAVAYMAAEVWGPRTYGCEVKNSSTQPMTICCSGFTDMALAGQPCTLR